MNFSKIKKNFRRLVDGEITVKDGLISKEDALDLFKISRLEDYLRLFYLASQVRDYFIKEIEITSTIHVTNMCKMSPKCLYCGFAVGASKAGYYEPFRLSDEDIERCAVAIEKSGICRVSCSSGHGYEGEEVIRALRIVKENTNLEVLVNAGGDLTEDSIRELKRYGVDTICCNLETINRELFVKLKPGESLDRRVEICKLVKKYNIELSSGLLIGIGESYRDRVDHLLFLKELDVDEIPVMGFNPYPDTPMEERRRCPALEQGKTIAITRLMFPNIRITSPTPTIGPELVQFALLAGASNIATVIPDNYPVEVRGVGNPKTGNLEEIVKIIKNLGLKPKLKSFN